MLDIRQKRGVRIFMISLVFIIVQGPKLFSQILELQNLPATTKWQQINTDNFRLIFPEGFESEAIRTANIMESIRIPASNSLYQKPRKFSIILQNKQGFSNGFVNIAPLRSEFFTISPQDYNSLGNVDWIEHLAVHEYRHMVQFSKTYSTGFNKLNYWLFGEYGLATWATLAAPSWFWEGDAVGIETSMTAMGRGRLPWFSLAYKTNLLEKGGFNYSKQYLKSFKEFIPNHYVTGYFITTHLKRKYGVDVWDKIIKHSFRFPFIPFGFSNAIKKITGKNILQTYIEMNKELIQLYTNQVTDIITEKRKIINKRNKETYTNYFYPTQISNYEIIALKSGFSDISTFISIDKQGSESKIFTPGLINNSGQLSIKSNKIVWVEYEFDPRWSKQSYSVIKIYDINTQEYKVLTHKSRYTSAALSPDGKLIVAIHNSENNDNAIHILDAKNGNHIKTIDNPKNIFYSMPSFSDNGKSLVLLKYVKRIKSIVIKNIESGKEKTLISSETENYGHPVQYKGYVYYNSAINGIDNIYAINIESKEIYQITNAKYGAFNPSISQDGKQLFYNVYSRIGMNIASTTLDKSVWKKIEQVKNLNFNYQAPMVKGEGISDVLKNRLNTTFKIKPYSQLKSLIRPFSWGLISIPVNNVYTFGINSRDVLNTTSISAGLIYNAQERSSLKFANISYQGFYPIIDLFAFDGTRNTKRTINKQIQTFDWNESSITAGLRLPLILTNSKYLRKINLQARTRITKITNYNNPVASNFEQQNGILRGLEYKFEYIRVLKRSKLDINSRFGQMLAINYKHTPIGGNYNSNLFSIESNLYFPGFIKHHSIHLRGTFQVENKKNYRFSSPITFTRGFGYIVFDSYTNLALNYAMPLFYPDIHIGPLFNLQRVYTNVFYDTGKGKSDGFKDFILKSYGAEVSINFNVMRFLPLFNMGIRYSYLPDFNDSVVQVLIGGVNF